MASKQVDMHISPTAYAQLREVKDTLAAERDRGVSFNEVVEELTSMWKASRIQQEISQ